MVAFHGVLRHNMAVAKPFLFATDVVKFDPLTCFLYCCVTNLPLCQNHQSNHDHLKCHPSLFSWLPVLRAVKRHKLRMILFKPLFMSIKLLNFRCFVSFKIGRKRCPKPHRVPSVGMWRWLVIPTRTTAYPCDRGDQSRWASPVTRWSGLCACCIACARTQAGAK